jgi:predicted nuclease of predicted toxin-antitoxin system
VTLLADMGISPKTVAFLHALGHDAVHLAEQGLERLPDPGMVEKARQEGRMLLVHDLGFGELVAASGATLPSVITFRLRNMHPDLVNRTCYAQWLFRRLRQNILRWRLPVRAWGVAAELRSAGNVARLTSQAG